MCLIACSINFPSFAEDTVIQVDKGSTADVLLAEGCTSIVKFTVDSVSISDYKIEDGKLYLLGSYIATIQSGDHAISIIYNGSGGFKSVSATLKVKGENSPDPSTDPTLPYWRVDFGQMPQLGSVTQTWNSGTAVVEYYADSNVLYFRKKPGETHGETVSYAYNSKAPYSDLALSVKYIFIEDNVSVGAYNFAGRSDTVKYIGLPFDYTESSGCSVKRDNYIYNSALSINVGIEGSYLGSFNSLNTLIAGMLDGGLNKNGLGISQYGYINRLIIPSELLAKIVDECYLNKVHNLVVVGTVDLLKGIYTKDDKLWMKLAGNSISFGDKLTIGLSSVEFSDKEVDLGSTVIGCTKYDAGGGERVFYSSKIAGSYNVFKYGGSTDRFTSFGTVKNLWCHGSLNVQGDIENIYWDTDKDYSDFTAPSTSKIFVTKGLKTEEVAQSKKIPYGYVDSGLYGFPYVQYLHDAVYDYKAQSNIISGVHYGVGGNQATAIKSVKVGSGNVPEHYIIEKDGNLEIDSLYLQDLSNGYYDVEVTFNNDMSFEPGRIKVVNSPNVDTAPQLEKMQRVFNGQSPKDLQYRVSLGTGGLAASNVMDVIVDGVALGKDAWDYSGDMFSIKAAFLETLKDGLHAVSVVFNNAMYSSGAEIFVINSNVGGNSGSSGSNEHTNVEDSTKLFDYDIIKDIVFNINLGTDGNKANSISNVYIGDTKLNSSDYVFNGTDKLTISKNFLCKLKNGLHTVGVLFDNDIFSTRARIQVVNYKEIKEHPSVSDTGLDFSGSSKADITLQYSLGIGSLKANSIRRVTVGGREASIGVTDSNITITKEFMNTFSNGAYPVAVEFDTGYTDHSVEITVHDVTDKAPSWRTGGTKECDMSKPSFSALFSVDLGSGSSGVETVSKVLVGGKEIYPVLFSSPYLIINKQHLTGFPDGEHQIKVIFSNGTELTGASVNVINSDSTEIASSNPIVQNVEREFNFDLMQPVQYSLTYGYGSLKATGIKYVSIGDKVLNSSSYTNTDSYLRILPDAFKSVTAGTYTVQVTFDNNYVDSNATVKVVGIEKEETTTPGVNPGEGDNEDKDPPEALTTITYEFYKDHPDYVIIPIKLNSATEITELKIGQTVVSEQDYELQEGAILLNKSYLSTLDAGKYRVLPTFNDPKNTQISNIQLIVYEKLEDRAAPGLLQSRILFKGQDLRLRYTYGSGDLMANNVLALVIDDKIILPSGETKDFTNVQVSKVRKAYTALEASNEIEESTSSNARRATSSNARRRVASSEQRALISALSSDEPVFTVEADEIILKGDYVESLGLSDGDHLIGAIFDNSEKTTDLKKVVLTIEKEQEPEKPGTDEPGKDEPGTDKPGTDNPGTDNPGTDNPGTDKPGTGDGKPGTDNPGTDKPGAGDNKPGTGDDKPGTDTPEPGGDKPGTDNPGTDNPGTDNPGTDKPGAGGSGGTGGSSENTGGIGGAGSYDNPIKRDNPLVNKENKEKNDDGSINTGYRPAVPNMGGTFTKHRNTEDGKEVTIYILPDGTVPLGAWIADGINWYYQGLEGYILTDWFLDADGTWYELDKQSGYMLRGWYYEEADGKWYYLNPADGKMLTGWQFIDSVWYYFNPVAPVQTYFGDNANGWYYDAINAGRPFGSMYSNEVTPDNYFVGLSGAYVK